MARPMQNHVFEKIPATPLGLGLFVGIVLLVALCAKHARQIPGKRSSETSEPNMPKQLITAMMHLIPARKPDPGTAEERGLWQKAILMGEKCRPPQFPGVIYYDYSGNRIEEMPMSPRASRLSPLRNFTSPSLDSMDNSPPPPVMKFSG